MAKCVTWDCNLLCVIYRYIWTKNKSISAKTITANSQILQMSEDFCTPCKEEPAQSSECLFKVYLIWISWHTRERVTYLCDFNSRKVRSIKGGLGAYPCRHKNHFQPIKLFNTVNSICGRGHIDYIRSYRTARREPSSIKGCLGGYADFVPRTTDMLANRLTRSCYAVSTARLTLPSGPTRYFLLPSMTEAFVLCAKQP